METVRASTFFVYNDYAFENLLRENDFSTQTTLHPTDFNVNLQKVIKSFQLQRNPSHGLPHPFYSDGDFFWIFATEGKTSNRRITSAALIRHDHNRAKYAELVYIDVADTDDLCSLVNLYQKASTIAGCWGKCVVPFSLRNWKEDLDGRFLTFIEEPAIIPA